MGMVRFPTWLIPAMVPSWIHPPLELGGAEKTMSGSTHVLPKKERYVTPVWEQVCSVARPRHIRRPRTCLTWAIISWHLEYIPHVL